MRSPLWTFYLLGLMAIVAGADKPAPAIVNGLDAPRGRFRYMANLRRTTDTTAPYCDATVIHPRVLLTAGHCTRDVVTGENFPPNMFKPVAHIGGYLRTQELPSNYQSFRVQDTVVNPWFKTGFQDPVTKNYLNYDAALMLLPAPTTMPVVKLVGTTRKPKLPVPVGTLGTLVGWGTVGFKDNEPQFVEPLQMIAQEMVNLTTCQSIYGTYTFPGLNGTIHQVSEDFYTNTMICVAKPTQPYGSACRGDSGGPLLVTGADASQDYQIGIVSWGSGDCLSQTSVFTDVGMIFDWISDQVYRWTGDRLQPWTPPPFRPLIGAVLPNNVAVGFNGKSVTYSGAKGAPLDIISSVPAMGLGWYLNGILTDGTAPGKQALGYVAWSYGATLAAQVAPSGRLVVTLDKKVVRPGHPPNLGKLVTIKYPADSCRHGWCSDRLVEITVRPFIKVAITQPWLPGSSKAARGSFAPFLQVKVTLLEEPAQQPTGVLGQTILV